MKGKEGRKEGKGREGKMGEGRKRKEEREGGRKEARRGQTNPPYLKGPSKRGNFG